MKPENLDDLIAVFQRVLDEHADFGKTFYAQLSVDQPELMKVFQQVSMRAQHTRFTGMISIILHRMHEARPYQSLLEDLGRQHEAFGVRARDLDRFGETLMRVIQRLAGADFNDEVQAQWHIAFGEIRATMARGMVRARDKSS